MIETLRKAPEQMVLVFEENGHFEGIITPMDVLEAITGGFLYACARARDHLLVSGVSPISEIVDDFLNI